MSNEDGQKDVQAREKVAEPPQSDRVEGQEGHPPDTPPVLSVDTPIGQGGQGRDTLDGQGGTPSKDRVDTPLSGKTRTRWKEAYREVFGEVDDLFEARVRRAMGLMERGEARSRVEALEAVRPWSPDHELDPLVGGPDGRPVEAGRILPLGVSLTGKQPGQKEEEEPGGKTAPSSPDDRADGALPPDTPGFSSSVESLKARTKWREAYRTVFGEEPDGQLAEARIRAAMNFYDPERSVGRRQALEAVRASEEEAASRTREAGRVFGEEPDDPQTDEEPEGEWLPLPSEDALTLGAALMKIGRLEAEVGELRRAVARLEERQHRTETRLGGLSPGLRALREAVREARDLVLKLSARVDTLATASSSEDKSLPPGKKELRELRARMDEERGRILLEVENRLEEAEELMRRSTENRIAALESWVRRVSRYLGIGKKGGLFR
ncbi:hypothetical protein Mesil_0522 [Allomeiothermus silvanus DSM 9946]|uniref:Uncharacterized protein n=1 Tax=Allomeiothermus silvanus (strain ATCC 700542 / DSM 9946 / NBRC 106475 / NCIMB 13440 / VI-R2) TaxID=526227 RepID=D7BA21_ALLS1|nr:hypothetical protein Mesil_0522 [Allomeiothermus silvanus DSM 9946]